MVKVLNLHYVLACGDAEVGSRCELAPASVVSRYVWGLKRATRQANSLLVTRVVRGLLYQLEHQPLQAVQQFAPCPQCRVAGRDPTSTCHALWSYEIVWAPDAGQGPQDRLVESWSLDPDGSLAKVIAQVDAHLKNFRYAQGPAATALRPDLLAFSAELYRVPILARVGEDADRIADARGDITELLALQSDLLALTHARQANRDRKPPTE